jgi:hypothetical protein
MAAAFMRAAYGKGYCDALTDAPPGAMLDALGYTNPARGKHDAATG